MVHLVQGDCIALQFVMENMPYCLQACERTTMTVQTTGLNSDDLQLLIRASAQKERARNTQSQPSRDLVAHRQHILSVPKPVSGTDDVSPVVGLGSFLTGLPCSSTGGVISKVCKIDAIKIKREEMAKCLPGQILPRCLT